MIALPVSTCVTTAVMYKPIIIPCLKSYGMPHSMKKGILVLCSCLAIFCCFLLYSGIADMHTIRKYFGRYSGISHIRTYMYPDRSAKTGYAKQNGGRYDFLIDPSSSHAIPTSDVSSRFRESTYNNRNVRRGLSI